MSPGTIGVFIPILGILLGFVAVIGSFYIKSQKMKLDLARTNAGSSAVQDDVHRELQRLKDRMAVVERLLTDDDRKLSSEIERLRAADARMDR